MTESKAFYLVMKYALKPYSTEQRNKYIDAFIKILIDLRGSE